MATNLTYNYSSTNNSVDLSWTTTDVNADHYKVYRRILETQINDVCLNEQREISYTDNNVLTVSNLFSPEIVINTQKEFGKIEISFINSQDNIRTYIYYVETYDHDNNILSSSNRVQVDITNTPDSYSYFIKKAEFPLTQQDQFTTILDPSITLTNMDNGEYIVYAYIQIGDIKSENAQIRFAVDNTIFTTTQYLDIPNGVRYNNRYRGPHESRKKDFSSELIKNNLNKLKKRVEYLDGYKAGMLEKPGTINVQLSNLIETIESSLSDIRKELKYDERNN